MARFRYKAMDRRGKVVEGYGNASTISALTEMLRAQGQFLVSAAHATDEPKAAPGRPKAAQAPEVPALPTLAPGQRPGGGRYSRAVGLNEVLVFTSELSLMVRAAVPVMEAISSLAAPQPNKRFRDALFDIAESVKSGRSLSESFGRHPQIFDSIYISLLAAGEASGTMPKMLERIAAQLNFRATITSKARSAMLYPSIVMGTALLIVLLLLIFVMPTFSEVFEQFDAPLPTSTKFLLWLSSSLRSRWYLYVGTIAAAYAYIRMRLRAPAARFQVDRWTVTAPVIGPVMKSIILTRTFRTLGELLQAGIPILQALKLCEAAAGNVVFAAMMRGLAKEAELGHTLASALELHEQVPEMAVRLVATAERTGRLPEALSFLSNYYEAQVDTAMKDLFAALEPIFVVFLGITIGGIALSMLLPIFRLGGIVG